MHIRNDPLMHYMQVLPFRDPDLHVLFYCCLAGKCLDSVDGHDTLAAPSVSSAGSIQKDTCRAERFHQICPAADTVVNTCREDMD